MFTYLLLLFISFFYVPYSLAVSSTFYNRNVKRASSYLTSLRSILNPTELRIQSISFIPCTWTIWLNKVVPPDPSYIITVLSNLCPQSYIQTSCHDVLNHLQNNFLFYLSVVIVWEINHYVDNKLTVRFQLVAQSIQASAM